MIECVLICLMLTVCGHQFETKTIRGNLKAGHQRSYSGDLHRKNTFKI